MAISLRRPYLNCCASLHASPNPSMDSQVDFTFYFKRTYFSNFSDIDLEINDILRARRTCPELSMGFEAQRCMVPLCTHNLPDRKYYNADRHKPLKCISFPETRVLASQLWKALLISIPRAVTYQQRDFALKGLQYSSQECLLPLEKQACGIYILIFMYFSYTFQSPSEWKI
jgi:hypothetical protein